MCAAVGAAAGAVVNSPVVCGAVVEVEDGEAVDRGGVLKTFCPRQFGDCCTGGYARNSSVVAGVAIAAVGADNEGVLCRRTEVREGVESVIGYVARGAVRDNPLVVGALGRSPGDGDFARGNVGYVQIRGTGAGGRCFVDELNLGKERSCCRCGGGDGAVVAAINGSVGSHRAAIVAIAEPAAHLLVVHLDKQVAALVGVVCGQLESLYAGNHLEGALVDSSHSCCSVESSRRKGIGGGRAKLDRDIESGARLGAGRSVVEGHLRDGFSDHSRERVGRNDKLATLVVVVSVVAIDGDVGVGLDSVADRQGLLCLSHQGHCQQCHQ